MATPRLRAMVSALSLAAAAAAPLALLGACARPAAYAASDDAVAPAALPLAIEFENEAPVQVDVYLVSERQQWRLGRVAPGALTTLKIPTDALQTTQGWMRLATLANAPASILVASDPRATLTMSQPLSELLMQRWRFRSSQLGPSRLLGAYEHGGRHE